MASYQDLESRVRSLEDKLDFILNNMQMTAAISSGLSGPDGRPLPGKIFKGSLKELYYLSRTLPTLTQTEAPPPPIDEENSNG